MAELKTRLPAKLLPLVAEYKGKLEKLGANQGAKPGLEKGDVPKIGGGGAEGGCLVAETGGPGSRFGARRGPVSFYLVKTRGGGGPRPRLEPRGKREGVAAGAGRGRLRKRSRALLWEPNATHPWVLREQNDQGSMGKRSGQTAEVGGEAAGPAPKQPATAEPGPVRPA